MKLLRILTGVHAGAQLQLTPGMHRIGANDDADIRLTDWRGADALLHTDTTGLVSVQRSVAAEDTAEPGEEKRVEKPGATTKPPAEVVLLVDFVPMQFDETILCIGPDDAIWPSDVDLLSMLLTRPAEALAAAERKKRRRYVGTAIACAILGIVIVTASLLTTAQMSRAAASQNGADRAQHINEALAAAHQSGLKAHALGNTVVVTGMVTTTADDDTVRTLLNRVSQTGITRNYDVAQNDTRSIEDSLGIAGAHVRYVGNGAFAVGGSVTSKAELEAAVARVRADLDMNVKSVSVDATEISNLGMSGPDAAYSELISSDDVKYAQTPDGVKHIYAVDPPAASDASAPASTSDAPATASVTSTSTPSSVGNGNVVNGEAHATKLTSVANSTSVDGDTVKRGAAGIAPMPPPSTLPAGARID